MPANRMLRIATAWRRILTIALKLKADVYHLHDPELLPLGWILKRKGRKVVYDAHEDTPKQIYNKPYLPPKLRKPLSRTFAAVEKMLANRLDFTVCVSPRIAGKFRKSAIVHNYPCAEEFAESSSLSLPYQERPRQVCYLGAISPSRGIRQIAEAANSIDGTVVLAGAAEPPALYRALRSGLGRLRYLGVLDRLGAIRLLGCSRVGLLILAPTPNYRESLPIKLFEYMSAGIPLVASNFSDWRKLGIERCAVFVNPADPAQISDAVNYLLDHPEIAEQMGKAGQKLAAKRFYFAREEKKLLELYSILTERMV
jgi:glycosyltransferase involved in cell wall biosynthesis